MGNIVAISFLVGIDWWTWFMVVKIRERERDCFPSLVGVVPRRLQPYPVFPTWLCHWLLGFDFWPSIVHWTLNWKLQIGCTPIPFSYAWYIPIMHFLYCVLWLWWIGCEIGTKLQQSSNPQSLHCLGSSIIVWIITFF